MKMPVFSVTGKFKFGVNACIFMESHNFVIVKKIVQLRFFFVKKYFCFTMYKVFKTAGSHAVDAQSYYN